LVQYGYDTYWQCCKYCVVAGSIPRVVEWGARKKCKAIGVECNKPNHAYFVKEIQHLQKKLHISLMSGRKKSYPEVSISYVMLAILVSSAFC
jgi:hypothetical protein